MVNRENEIRERCYYLDGECPIGVIDSKDCNSSCSDYRTGRDIMDLFNYASLTHPSQFHREMAEKNLRRN